MSVNPSDPQAARAQTQHSVPGDVWHVLVQQVTHLSVAQIDAFAARLGNAFFAASEQIGDAREANLTFNAGQLLKNNAYAFYYLASSALEKGFRAEIEALRAPSKPEAAQQDIALSLVSYEEMDQKLALGRASRAFELASAEELAALNMRLAHLLGQESLNIAQNPFRPEVFLRILYSVWCEYCTDVDAHHLILPMLRADILFDLQAILRSLNETLVLRGVLPDLQESYRIRKTTSSNASTNTASNEEAHRNRTEKLRQFLSEEASIHAQGQAAHAAANFGIAGGQAIHAGGFDAASSASAASATTSASATTWSSSRLDTGISRCLSRASKASNDR